MRHRLEISRQAIGAEIRHHLVNRQGNTRQDCCQRRHLCANNVEQVVWTNMPPGAAKIVIRAFHITRFPQAYSYAWRIS